MTMEIYAQRRAWSDDVEVMLIAKRSGAAFVGRPVVFEQVPVGIRCDPTITLERQDAQRLMDELWNAGLRPSEGTGSAGALVATQRHLDDMREIAKGLLKGEF